jgi:hypothetical protein
MTMAAIHSVGSGKRIRVIRASHPLAAATFSCDETRVILATELHELLGIDIATGHQVFRFPDVGAHVMDVFPLSDPNQFLLIQGQGITNYRNTYGPHSHFTELQAALWSMSPFQLVASAQIEQAIYLLKFVPASDELFFRMGYGQKRWDLNRPQNEPKLIEKKGGWIFSNPDGGEISPDGRYQALLGSNLAQVIRIDPVDGTPEDHFQIQDNTFHFASFSLQPSRLAGVSALATLIAWDLESREELLRMPIRRKELGGNDFPSALAISGNGKWIALGWEDGVIEVFDLSQAFEGRAPRKTLRNNPHQTQIKALHFSEVGNALVSQGVDGLIAVWGVR